MKLITLNVWGGKIKDKVDDFLKSQSQNGVDIFCLQEIFSDGNVSNSADLVNFEAKNLNLLREISTLLPNYQAYFCPVYSNVYGIATFVKKNISVIKTGEIILFENKKFPDPEFPNLDHTRKMQWLEVKHSNKNYLIMNLHGHWTGTDKKDNDNRIKQSKNILAFTKSRDLPMVLCGDFNLKPDTESIRMIEKSFNNLIVKNGITSTRTSLYKKSDEKFADYIFTSPEVEVIDFKVLPDVCSDHTPLFLEFK